MNKDNEIKKAWYKYQENWKAFFLAVTDVWVLAAVSVTLLFGYVLIRQKANSQPDIFLVTVLTLIISLASGVAGGIAAKRWDDIVGEKVIVARGKVAVRSLKVLLGQTIAMGRRVKYYLSQCSNGKGEDLPRATQVQLEEVVEKCDVLIEHVTSSIENWTDILPEDADVQSQIREYQRLKVQVIELTNQIQQLNSQLLETKDKSQTEISQLRKEKEDKEKELRQIRQQLETQTAIIGSPLTTGSFIGLSPALSWRPITSEGVQSVDLFGMRECTSCGKKFQLVTSWDNPSGETICPECRTKRLTLSGLHSPQK